VKNTALNLPCNLWKSHRTTIIKAENYSEIWTKYIGRILYVTLCTSLHFYFLRGILTYYRNGLKGLIISFHLSFILVMKSKCISLKSVLILSPIPDLVYLTCDLGKTYKIVWKFYCGLRLPPRCKTRSSLFYDVTQRRLVFSYRHFISTYLSHPRG